MFGQQKSGFGSTGFGSSNTGSLFGNKTNTAGSGLFGNTAGSSGFGATSNTSSFGSFGNTTTGGIFGTPASKPTPNLFGTPTQGFGTSTQNSFGGSSFGRTQTNSLFGSSTPASTPASFGGGLFGSGSAFGTQTSGTGGTKYTPVSGSDTMMKNGLQQSISTKHQCITAMKEYEGKSFEELRCEDYHSGRKGPAAGSSAFGTAAASSTTGFSFGQNQPTSSLFGSSAAKPAFGATSGGLFGNTNTSNSGGLFGAKTFGTSTANSSGFSFGNTSTGGGVSLFGSGTKPAGSVFGNTATSSGGLFGNTAGSAFGTGTGFGGTSNLFGKSTGGFGSGTQTSTGFGNTGTNLFGSSAKPSGGLFGASGGFGQSNTSGSLFGGNKPAFGVNNTSTGGLFGNTLTTGNTQNKGLFGGGFGTGSNLGGTSGFNFNTGTGALGGGTNTFGGIGTGSFGNTMFGQQANSATANAITLPSASNQQSSEILQALLTAPFGDSPLFKNSLSDPSKRQEMLKPTNPIAQQIAIQSPVYRVSSGSKPKIKPKAHSSLSPRTTGGHGKPHQLFAGLEPEEDATVSNRSFVGRASVKRLTIKVTPNTGSYPGTPRGSSSSSSVQGSFKESVEPGKAADMLSPDMITSNKSQLFSKKLYPVISELSTSELNDQSTMSLNVPETPAKIDDVDADSPSQESDGLSRSTIKQSVQPNISILVTENTENEATNLSDQTANQVDDVEIVKDIRLGRPTLFNDTMSDLNVHTKKSSVLDNETSSLDLIMRASSSDPNIPLEVGSDEPHPTGIILRRTGYYTIPSMDELANMLDEENRCKIINFTVGRMGYGSVFFSGVVDVTGLNLDEIVHIRRKEVTLYPDETTKPPIGSGLNRPAEITLDCVWPTDKATREPVVDPERLSHMKWEQKLEQTTAKMGARFRDYRPETGSWVFEVNHFSKYGLPESDDEIEIEVDQPEENATCDANVKKLPPKKTTLWSTRAEADRERESLKQHVGLDGEGVYVGDSPLSKLQLDKDGSIQDDEKMLVAGDDAVEDVSTPSKLQSLSQKMALGMGVKPQRLQSMKESFFADEDEEQGDCPTANRLNTMLLVKPQVSDLRSFSTELKGILVKSSSRSSSPASAIPIKSRSDRTKRLRKTTFVEAFTKPIPVFNKTRKEPSSSFISKAADDAAAAPAKPKMPAISAPKRKIAWMLASSMRKSQSFACDSSDFLGRSFRVGWGPGWMLVHSGSTIAKPDLDSSMEADHDRFSLFSSTNKQMEQSFKVKLEVVTPAPHLSSAFQEELETEFNDLPYLDVAFCHSSFVSNEEAMDQSDINISLDVSVSSRDVTVKSSLPFLEPNSGVAAMEAYTDRAMRAWESVDVTHSDSGFTLACHNVFSLCSTLWGRLHGDCDETDSYSCQMLRKRMLVSWLVRAIEADSIVGDQRGNAQDSVEEVFRYVCDGKLDKAVQNALQSGNGHLACLLSSCSATNSQVAAAKQLVEWIDTDTDKFISEAIIKLYCLLARKPTWLSGKGPINTCDGLDWKRSLLLHLTYLSEPVSPLSEGLQLYRTAWKGESEFGVYSAAPVPPYVERSRTTLNSNEKDDCNVRDVCYHLLQLYCKRSHRLDSTLCPSSFVPHPLDHRLSWHVWRLLFSAGYRTNMKKTSLNSLHVSYAAQLESRGFWHQAAFVLLHIQNSRQREIAIRNLLGRYVTSCQKAEEDFVFQKLNIPKEWLHECRALHAKSCHVYTKMTFHLLQAGRWRYGHDALMRHVAADSLVHGRLSYLKDMLMMINNANAASRVNDWDFAGKVYLDHLILTDRISQLKEDSSLTAQTIEAEFEILWPQVTSLCQRVADLRCYNAKDRLARADMAKQTLNLYNAMHSLLKEHEITSYDKAASDRFAPLNVLASQTTRMHLPEDYAIQDLSKVVEKHFIELVSLRKHAE